MTENLPVRKSKAKQIVLVAVAFLLVFGLLAYFVSVFRSNIKSSLSSSADKSEVVVDPMNEMEGSKEVTPFVTQPDKEEVSLENEEVIEIPRTYEDLFPPFVEPEKPVDQKVVIKDVDMKNSTILLSFYQNNFEKRYSWLELQVLEGAELNGVVISENHVGREGRFVGDANMRMVYLVID